MKVLTVCHGGNVRSVALAYVLKNRVDADALACGWAVNSAQTIAMLCEWADRIIVVQEHYREKIPMKYRDKLAVYDVGRDRWLNSLDPQLRSMFQRMVTADPFWDKNCGRQKSGES
jgi:predicted protein tyrosine phosphatase